MIDHLPSLKVIHIDIHDSINSRYFLDNLSLMKYKIDKVEKLSLKFDNKNQIAMVTKLVSQFPNLNELTLNQ